MRVGDRVKLTAEAERRGVWPRMSRRYHGVQAIRGTVTHVGRKYIYVQWDLYRCAEQYSLNGSLRSAGVNGLVAVEKVVGV